MPIETTIVTAVSTLLGVGLTLYFTNRREESRFAKDLRLKDYNDLKSFYVKLLATIEQAKTFTEYGKDYDELFVENSIISAQVNLIAPDEINEKFAKVSQTLRQWSSLYRQSLPINVGNTGKGIVTSGQMEYRKKANEIDPKLFNEIGELVIAIKKELSKSKKELSKP